MKTKHIISMAAAALLPVTAFSQPPSPPTPPAPPAPPGAPIPPRDRDRERNEPKVPVTYLGVETSEIPSVLCDQLGLPKGFGLVVEYVAPDGPAAAAGVQQNDIIKMLNDQILTDPGQLGKLVRSYQDGTTVTLTLMRKGQEQKVSVKLAKKEVPRRHAAMDHFGHGFNFQFGDAGDPDGWNLGNLQERLRDLKDQLGDQQKGMIHDAVMQAREEVKRAAEEARENARRIRTFSRMKNGALQQTTIDLKNAQIVMSDDKGELRIENKEGKKFLTAKDPQGKVLFTGPIDTKEELDKVPADVRQRYDNLEQRDIPAVVPPDLQADNDNDMDDDDGDVDDESAQVAAAGYQQVCAIPAGFGVLQVCAS